DKTVEKLLDDPWGALEHITALRIHLARGSAVFLLASVGAFMYAQELLDWFTGPIGGIDKLLAVEVTEPISVFMRISLLTGFAISLPYIILELWLFVAPGIISIRSRWLGLFSIPFITLLFVGGMAFAFYVMLKPALGVLIGFLEIPHSPRPASYMKFVTNLMFWIGIAFEFPIVIGLLAAMGLVRAEVLLQQTRIIVVGLAVVAAAATPTVDPVNMMIVWGPLVGLYFFGLGIAFVIQYFRDRRQKAQA
ncbi:MAG: preprotein translocase subunit TatC, partial [Chloroflexi bacterium]|nr:preprotein translocase subunit TatC [Chloroflexota bacterium]